jgi:5'-3' exonuclease
MILLDFSGISISSVFSQANKSLDEGMLRHMILNSLRMYNLKYRDKYGKLVIACDSSSWRKGFYPEYKAARKKNRDNSSLDWESIFKTLNKVKDEIIEHLPYPVIQVQGAEADDVIATLVESTQEFGSYEPVMIVSADKDFIQLQKYENVKQFSPMTKKMVTDPNPSKYLFEHILRGDNGDGVPNVLSADDVFISESNQTPLRSKKIEEWYAASKSQDPESFLDPSVYRNYIRNKMMIDLSQIPEGVSSSIMEEYHSLPKKNNSKVLSYLVSRRCNSLIACADEFFVK